CTGTLRGNHSNPETQCSLKSLISPNQLTNKRLEFKVITTFNVDGRAKWRNIYEFLYLPGLVCCKQGTRRLFLPYFSCALNNTNGRGYVLITLVRRRHIQMRFLFDKYDPKYRALYVGWQRRRP